MPHQTLWMAVMASLLGWSCNRPKPELQGAVDAGSASATVPLGDRAWKSRSGGDGGLSPVAERPLTNEQLVLVLRDSNRAEIQQSRLAEQKGQDAALKRFAQQVATAHSDMQDKINALNIGDANSPASLDLEQAAGEVLSKLTAASGPAFDAAYLRAQEDQHRRLLELLDPQLMAEVSRPELKRLLGELRPMLEQHRAQAQSLSRDLQHASGAPATGVDAGAH